MDTEFSENRVTIHSADGTAVPGIFTEPREGSSVQMLMLHGITTHKNEFGDFFGRVARLLAHNGIGTLRIDFRGHGDSPVGSRSFSIASQVLDTLASIDWLLSNTKAERANLLGCSFGAPPTLFAAQLRPQTVGSISLLCPVLDYHKTFLEPSTEWAAELFNPTTLSQADQTGVLYMTDNFAIDIKLIIEMAIIKPFEALRQLQAPTLLIHGEADSMVPYTISKEYAMDLDHVRFLGMPHMEHGFTDENDEIGDSPKSQENLKQIANEVLSQVRRLS